MLSTSELFYNILLQEWTVHLHQKKKKLENPTYDMISQIASQIMKFPENL